MSILLEISSSYKLHIYRGEKNTDTYHDIFIGSIAELDIEDLPDGAMSLDLLGTDLVNYFGLRLKNRNGKLKLYLGVKDKDYVPRVTTVS